MIQVIEVKPCENDKLGGDCKQVINLFKSFFGIVALKIYMTMLQR